MEPLAKSANVDPLNKKSKLPTRTGSPNKSPDKAKTAFQEVEDLENEAFELKAELAFLNKELKLTRAELPVISQSISARQKVIEHTLRDNLEQVLVKIDRHHQQDQIDKKRLEVQRDKAQAIMREFKTQEEKIEKQVFGLECEFVLHDS